MSRLVNVKISNLLTSRDVGVFVRSLSYACNVFFGRLSMVCRVLLSRSNVNDSPMLLLDPDQHLSPWVYAFGGIFGCGMWGWLCISLTEVSILSAVCIFFENLREKAIDGLSGESSRGTARICLGKFPHTATIYILVMGNQT